MSHKRSGQTDKQNHAALADANSRLRAEIERLQAVIDSRPAINAALPGSYIDWSQRIYVMEALYVLSDGRRQ